MRIALDAMGGDHAPGPIVAGAVQAVAADPDLTVVLVGDRAQVEPLLPADGARDRVEVFHAADVVGMEETPVEALARSRTTPSAAAGSSWPARRSTASSAPATPARWSPAACCPGGSSRASAGPASPPSCRRPRGRASSSTSGPTSIPKPRTCSSTASWARIFARHILGKENPTIGLMNVGEEEGKGHDLARRGLRPVRRPALKDRFVGNIEGRDIHRGACRRGRHRRLRRQRRPEGLRGRLRVRHEDGRPRRSSGRCRTTRPRR